jgi:hypothetical protein
MPDQRRSFRGAQCSPISLRVKHQLPGQISKRLGYRIGKYDSDAFAGTQPFAGLTE